jgi:hypothetical protein
MRDNLALHEDTGWMRKEPESVYDKWNISVVICDTDIYRCQPSHDGDGKTFEVMIST